MAQGEGAILNLYIPGGKKAQSLSESIYLSIYENLYIKPNCFTTLFTIFVFFQSPHLPVNWKSVGSFTSEKGWVSSSQGMSPTIDFAVTHDPPSSRRHHIDVFHFEITSAARWFDIGLFPSLVNTNLLNIYLKINMVQKNTYVIEL